MRNFANECFTPMRKAYNKSVKIRLNNMSEQNVHKIGFLVALINEFARRFHLTDKESYNYISKAPAMCIVA